MDDLAIMLIVVDGRKMMWTGSHGRCDGWIFEWLRNADRWYIIWTIEVSCHSFSRLYSMIDMIRVSAVSVHFCSKYELWKILDILYYKKLLILFVIYKPPHEHMCSLIYNMNIHIINQTMLFSIVIQFIIDILVNY